MRQPTCCEILSLQHGKIGHVVETPVVGRDLHVVGRPVVARARIVLDALEQGEREGRQTALVDDLPLFSARPAAPEQLAAQQEPMAGCTSGRQHKMTW